MGHGVDFDADALGNVADTLENASTEPGSWCRVAPYTHCVKADPPEWFVEEREWREAYDWQTNPFIDKVVAELNNFDHTSNETMVVPSQLLALIRPPQDATVEDEASDDKTAAVSSSADGHPNMNQVQKRRSSKRAGGMGTAVGIATAGAVVGAVLAEEEASLSSAAKTPISLSLVLAILLLTTVYGLQDV